MTKHVAFSRTRPIFAPMVVCIPFSNCAITLTPIESAKEARHYDKKVVSTLARNRINQAKALYCSGHKNKRPSARKHYNAK